MDSLIDGGGGVSECHTDHTDNISLRRKRFDPPEWVELTPIRLYLFQPNHVVQSAKLRHNIITKTQGYMKLFSCNQRTFKNLDMAYILNRVFHRLFTVQRCRSCKYTWEYKVAINIIIANFVCFVKMWTTHRSFLSSSYNCLDLAYYFCRKPLSGFPGCCLGNTDRQKVSAVNPHGSVQ